MPREEVLAVVLLLQISFHQQQEMHLSRLSAVMVVQLGPSWLEDGVWLLIRVSLRGSHSSSHSQQSRLRRESRPRRQSRQLSHCYAALVVPVL